MVRDERPHRCVEVEITPGRANRARVNRAPVPRPRDVLGVLRTVLFAPEDLALVKGDPGERRRFLDELLVARAPRFAGVRSDYDRVLKQRNALLKSAGAARGRGRREPARPSTCGTATSRGRRASCSRRGSRSPQTSSRWSPRPTRGVGDPPRDVRACDCDDQSSIGTARTCQRDELDSRALLEALARPGADELERGVSLVGPHRDELAARRSARCRPGATRATASPGRYALALRLAAYDLLSADGGEPVLILDDVFAELDARRRPRLAELVAPAEQVLVTAAVPEDVR